MLGDILLSREEFSGDHRGRKVGWKEMTNQMLPNIYYAPTIAFGLQ